MRQAVSDLSWKGVNFLGFDEMVSLTAVLLCTTTAAPAAAQVPEVREASPVSQLHRK